MVQHRTWAGDFTEKAAPQQVLRVLMRPWRAKGQYPCSWQWRQVSLRLPPTGLLIQVFISAVQVVEGLPHHIGNRNTGRHGAPATLTNAINAPLYAA